jgi:hypothetical protein
MAIRRGVDKGIFEKQYFDNFVLKLKESKMIKKMVEIVTSTLVFFYSVWKNSIINKVNPVQ